MALKNKAKLYFQAALVYFVMHERRVKPKLEAP
jgi:hypothetical protein